MQYEKYVDLARNKFYLFSFYMLEKHVEWPMILHQYEKLNNTFQKFTR